MLYPGSAYMCLSPVLAATDLLLIVQEAERCPVRALGMQSLVICETIFSFCVFRTWKVCVWAPFLETLVPVMKAVLLLSDYTTQTSASKTTTRGHRTEVNEHSYSMSVRILMSTII